MPKMSTRKKMIYHATRVEGAINRALMQLQAVEETAEGKNDTVTKSMTSLALMGLTWLNVVTAFRKEL